MSIKISVKRNIKLKSVKNHVFFTNKNFKINELSKLPEPFISSLFTLSSHGPYDFPGEHKLSFNSKSDKYINSVAYSDKHFGAFMESVKDEDWYQNTLFVIVADHSHNSPRKWRVAQKERFKIPMLWYGEVLKEAYQGSTHSQMGSHIDINKSILSQLQIDGSNYDWPAATIVFTKRLKGNSNRSNNALGGGGPARPRTAQTKSQRGE